MSERPPSEAADGASDAPEGGGKGASRTTPGPSEAHPAGEALMPRQRARRMGSLGWHARVVPLAVLLTLTLAAAWQRAKRAVKPVYDPSVGLVPTSVPDGGSALAMPLAQAVAAAAVRGPAAGSTAAPIGPFQAHGGVARTHQVDALGPVHDRVSWMAEVGGAVVAQVTVSPDGRTLYAATLAGDVVALDAATGRVGWRANLGGRVYGTPTVDRVGAIYVGSDAKQLFALAPDGKVTWKFATEGEADTAPLLLPDGDVVVAAGKELVALSPTGNVRYRVKAKGKIYSSPAQLTSGLVVFGAQDNCVYGVDGTGAIVFRRRTSHDVDGSPVAAPTGEFYVGNDSGEVLKFSARGDVIWTARVGGYVRGALSLSRSGDVLVGHYGPTPRVVRLRADDGAIIGAISVQGTGAAEFGVHGGPLEDAAGALYFGAQDDYVTALAPDGTLRFRFLAGSDVDAPLTLLPSGMLIVPTDSGKVYALGGP